MAAARPPLRQWTSTLSWASRKSQTPSTPASVKGEPPTPMPGIVHPQCPDRIPLGGDAQRLLGLAVVPEVHDPGITLGLEPGQVGLGSAGRRS